MLRLFTGRPHQTLSQVTLLGSLRGCLNKSAEELFWPQERNRRCPMFRDLMLFRAGAVQFAGPGGPLPLFAHDPEPHVISSLPDLPPKAQHVALQRLYSHIVQLCLRTDLSILIGLRTLCLFLEAETRRFDHTREHRLADSAFLKKLEHSTKLAKLASRYIKIQRSQQVVEAQIAVSLGIPFQAYLLPRMQDRSQGFVPSAKRSFRLYCASPGSLRVEFT